MSSGEFTLEDLQGGGSQDLVGQVRCGCRVERLLGRGGMGAVYLARRPDGALAVIKTLASGPAMEPSLRERFRREWEALARLHPHPNVVRVYEVAEAGEPLILMEYVEGDSLLKLLQQHGRLPPAEAVRAARDLARGLAAVHAHGLLHRDVKPANAIRMPSGQVKLVDFGLAKDLFRTALTEAGQILGTAHYMSPEQWEGVPVVDPRCDVFSLGATLYHLLTGKPPFEGEDVHETGDLIRCGEYDPPSDSVPGLPQEVELALARMLMVEPDLRYPTMRACAEDLDRVLAGRPARVPCLVGALGRFPLIPARRITIGADAECGIRLNAPGVSPRHAQMRREGPALVLRNLRGSSGTSVNDAPLSRPHPLQPGDRVRFGALEMVVQLDEVDRGAGPGSGRLPAQGAGGGQVSPQVALLLQDVARLEATPPAIEVLALVDHPGAALIWLERLLPDPFALEEARTLIATLLGEEVAARAAHARQELANARAREAPGRLRALTGQDPGTTPQEWLAWWAQARGGAPPQIGLPERAGLRLLSGSNAVPLERGSVWLLGRDSRCHLQVEGEGVARLHATVIRLHRRLIVRDEGAGLQRDAAAVRTAFIDPGAVLSLGEGRVRLVAPPAPAQPVPDARGLHPLEPDTFEALVRMRHPTVCAALVGLLRSAARTGGLEAGLSRLHPDDLPARRRLIAGVREAYTQRASTARELLPALLGGDPGTDLDGWSRLLSARLPLLPPQVVPAGWL